jgi:hypothetical protein
MHEVMEVPLGACKTRLWISHTVAKELSRLRKRSDPNATVWRRLKRGAQMGLELYERQTPPVVKHEWGGVYRIGFINSLFRIIGFYKEDRKDVFIAIDAFTKRDQRLSAAERSRVNEVVRVKELNLWTKVESNESFPRLAQ